MKEDHSSTSNDQFLDENGVFSGEKFVGYLVDVASKIPYDYNVPKREQLPPYYEEVKFKRAQDLFREYQSNLLFVKLAGLVTLLVDESAVKIIMLTNRSSTPETACVRYKDTIKHVITWYTGDFSENSALWRSIYKVKAMHHAANLLANKIPGMPKITQLELSGTILGFIGFAIARPEAFGMASLTCEQKEELLHFWRVIGYLLGVDDRFNICRESLQETEAIFRALIETLVKDHMLLKDSNCLRMQVAAIQGIGMFGPRLEPKCFLNFTYDLVFWGDPRVSSLYFEMSFRERVRAFLFRMGLKLLQYRRVRNFINNAIAKVVTLN